MLPRLVVSGSEKSPRGTLMFLCCALTMLGLPTFYGVAQSQEGEPAVENKAAAVNPASAVKETTESEPAEQQPVRDPEEPSVAELVARFNKLAKSQEYGEAKLIARMVKDIDPHDPVGEIMMWKATYRLGEIKTYSSARNDRNVSRPKASVSGDAHRPPAATPGIDDDDEAERATRRLRGIEKNPDNFTLPVTTSPKTVQRPAQLPAAEPARATIPVTPEMAKLVEQFNVALKEKRFEAAGEIARKAKQLEPENPTSDIMLWKAKFVQKVTHPSPEFLPQSKASPREIEIVRKLDQPIAFDFDDQPLGTALRQLEKQLGFNIFLDVVSMEKHKLGRNQTVTIRVSEISLKNALKLVLDAHDLTFLLEHERMTVLPKLEASSRLETRIYPVRDLVIEKEDFDALIEAIRGSVAPESWNERASISSVPATGSLVIFQSPGVHSDILELLRALREAKEVPTGGAGVGRKGPDNPTAGIGIGANGGGGGGFF